MANVAAPGIDDINNSDGLSATSPALRVRGSRSKYSSSSLVSKEMDSSAGEEGRAGESVAVVNGGRKLEANNSPDGTQKKPIMFIVCFLGIFFSYFIYGLIQETVTKRKFGEEYFRFVVSLVLIQCLVNAAFARVACYVSRCEVSLAPYNYFPVLSFTYVGAMVTSNASLAYITYPTQVLGKSAKPIPVLIIGMLVGGKRYASIKYLVVLLIVGGVSLFLYKEGSQSTVDSGQYRFLDTLGLGELLVLASLVMDGLSAALQEKLRDKSIGPFHMMYAVNIFSAIYLAVTAIVTGEIVQVALFIQRHPIVLVNIAAFSISSAVGQNFIFWTVIHFGPLTTSIITTTRKFFTILGSVIIFGNSLILRQWVGVFLVFSGLGIDIFYGKAFKSTKP